MVDCGCAQRREWLVQKFTKVKETWFQRWLQAHDRMDEQEIQELLKEQEENA